MQKKEIEMIFSMTDFEMKLVLESLKKTLQDKSIQNNRHNTKLKMLHTKVNLMIEKQTPYA
jgi:hypothetical protein